MTTVAIAAFAAFGLAVAIGALVEAALAWRMPR